MGFKSHKHLVQSLLPGWHLSRSPSVRNLSFLAHSDALFPEILDLGSGISCLSPPSGDLVDGLPLVAHRTNIWSNPCCLVSNCRGAHLHVIFNYGPNLGPLFWSSKILILAAEPAVRVPPAVTWLTVYRWLHIQVSNLLTPRRN